ncbi:hypothetical protein [Actinomadura sp. KC345]|uniref:hypothetical protein n=1 Tax=Actinomadura sp. KC345 TaxID=2530371 RepID=UPI001A9DE0F0|nr:hypothetical protein [Actinomadura sp. KC345]
MAEGLELAGRERIEVYPQAIVAMCCRIQARAHRVRRGGVQAGDRVDGRASSTAGWRNSGGCSDGMANILPDDRR